MKKGHKITLVVAFSAILIFLIYILNKIVFVVSTMKELLYSANSNYFNWRFGKIFYTKRGSGTPVLLIHDMDCTSSDYEWREIVQKLSETHTVYTLDLLGCGRSDKPKMTYTNYLYVQLISDFIKNVIKHKTDIVSTGKTSSAVIMACYIDTQLFGNLILINPSKLSGMNKVPKYKHKLLITGEFSIKNKSSNIKKISKLLKNIYGFEGKELELVGQELTYDEYMVLMTSKRLNYVLFHNSVVKFTDNSLVPTQILLKPLIDVEYIMLCVFYFNND